MVQDGPQSDAFLANDLDETRAAHITLRVLQNLLLQEVQGFLVKVVAECCDTPMPKQLYLVVQFEHLGVLLLPKLVPICLPLIEILTVVIVIVVGIVVTIIKKVVVVARTVQVRPLDKALIIIDDILS